MEAEAAFPFNAVNCCIVTSPAKAPSFRGGREGGRKEALLITPATEDDGKGRIIVNVAPTFPSKFLPSILPPSLPLLSILP